MSRPNLLRKAVAAAIVASVAAAGCTRIDRRIFEGLVRQSKSIEDQVPAKVDLARYRDLVNGMSDELAGATARAHTRGERAVLAEYDTALTGLKDILAVWEAKDRSRSDLLPIRDAMPARIAREYNLAVNTNEPPSIYASEAMQAIWATTKPRLEAAAAH